MRAITEAYDEIGSLKSKITELETKLTNMAALVARKDEALKEMRLSLEPDDYLGDISMYDYIDKTIAITADSVEVVEVGTATHCALEGWTDINQSVDFEDGTTKLYTITVKDSS